MLASVRQGLLVAGVALVAACGGGAAQRPVTALSSSVHSAPVATDPAAEADAALARGQARNDEDDYDGAVPELERAVRLLAEASPRDDRKLAGALDDLGDAYRELNRWDDAERTMRRRLAIAERLKDERLRASALAGVARVLSEAGDPQASIPLFEEAIAIDETLGVDDDDEDKMAYVHNLGRALGDTGDLDGAIALLERALASDQRRDPESNATSTTMHNLAINVRDAGDLARAQVLFEEALRIKRAVHGNDSPNLVSTLNGLAGTLTLAGELDEAKAIYRESLSLMPYGRSISRAVALEDLGRVENEQGLHADALAHLDEAVTILEQIFPDPRGHAEIVRTLVKRTASHLGLKRIADAERDTATAIRMSTAVNAGNPAEIAGTITWLADTWAEAGYPKRAAALRTQAAAISP